MRHLRLLRKLRQRLVRQGVLVEEPQPRQVDARVQMGWEVQIYVPDDEIEVWDPPARENLEQDD